MNARAATRIDFEASRTLIRRLTTFSSLAALAATALGVVVLTGWALDIGVLKSLQPGYATMKANTALGFMLAAAALLLFRYLAYERPASRRARRSVRRSGRVLAGIGFTLALAAFLEDALDADFAIGELVFPDTTSAPMPAGRMSPATALSLVLLCAALALLPARAERVLRAAQ